MLLLFLLPSAKPGALIKRRNAQRMDSRTSSRDSFISLVKSARLFNKLRVSRAGEALRSRSSSSMQISRGIVVRRCTHRENTFSANRRYFSTVRDDGDDGIVPRGKTSRGSCIHFLRSPSLSFSESCNERENKLKPRH